MTKLFIYILAKIFITELSYLMVSFLVIPFFWTIHDEPFQLQICEKGKDLSK